MDTIGKRLLYLRKEILKLTQREMAERMCVTSSYISCLETGDRQPSDMFLAFLALRFGVSEDWLRTGKEPIMRPAPETTVPAQVAEARAKYLNRGDVEEEDKDLAEILHDIRLFWANSPPDIRTWFKVQLHIAFPQIDEVKKSVEEQSASYTA